MNLKPPTVRLLVCGTADRGDDGAALAAVAHLLPTLPPELCERLEVRRCSQLDPSDFIDVEAGRACLVIDTTIGITPGATVTLPLSDLAAQPATIAPRSSHALPVDAVIRLAEVVRGSLPDGSFVGIGGKWFGYGPRFSRAVRAGLPEFEAAILAELVRLAGHAAPSFGPVVPPPAAPALPR